MASLKFVLFLSIGLQGYALTLNTDGLQSAPDAMRVNGDVCQDCTQIFELLIDLISNADLQKKIMDGIESLCDHLPGPATTAKLCKEEVEKMLPVAISFITGVVKPAQVCKIIGLCGSCDKQDKMLSYFVKEALQASVTSKNVQPTTQCSFCIFLIKTLEDLLPKERTEAAVIKLLEEICHILPPTYRDQCEAVIGKFSKTGGCYCRPMHFGNIQVQRHEDCSQMWNCVLLSEICLEVSRLQYSLKMLRVGLKYESTSAPPCMTQIFQHQTANICYTCGSLSDSTSFKY
ncbi:prosaposin-like protein [Lates japonicus]|uniref:Prosaposin-like protein n=1 Tax=Lates japonicus TaxID=270547 RepID=A0AAD3R4M5_LATJO|nr:prosaposin-like protein [Lates japonicus]